MLKNINDSREQQLEKLKNFTDTVNEEIANIVGTLGWTVESVTDVVSNLDIVFLAILLLTIAFM